MPADEWGAILRWYLTIQILSVPFVYIGRRVFCFLPDRGYVLTKSLAILLVSLCCWLAFAWLQIPYGNALPWVMWILCCGMAWMWRKTEIRQRYCLGLQWPAGPSRSVVWTTELMFGAIFLGWLWVLVHDPGIEHTEQPMDYMFMNSLWASEQFPPEDSWLAGFPVSYYYFGYWMLVCIAKASNIYPGLSYNLGQASWYALLWLGAFGLGYNIIAAWHWNSEPTQSPKRQGAAITAGILSSLCVALMGNLQGLFEWLYKVGVGKKQWFEALQVRDFPERATKDGEWFQMGNDWWWWRSARIIGDQDAFGQHLEVISEFPMFSYILGDNHPHVLLAPFLYLVLYLSLQLFLGTALSGNRHCKLLEKIDWPEVSSSYPLRYWHWGLAISLTVVAYLGNTWDLVTMLLVLPVSLTLTPFPSFTLRTRDWIRMPFSHAFLVLGGAGMLAIPHLLTFQSQIHGFQINWLNPTRLSQMLVMWGPLLMSCGLFLVIHSHRSLNSASAFVTFTAVTWLIPSILLLGTWWLGIADDTLSALVPDGRPWRNLILNRWGDRWLTPWLLGLLLGLGGAQFVIWYRRSQNNGHARPVNGFLLLCLTSGLLLLYAPEFVFLQDQFGPLMRMNTVFKFHYQAWHLLAPVMAVTLVLGLCKPVQWHGLATSAILIGLFVAGMVYPLAAIGSKVQAPSGNRTLDINQRLGTAQPAVAASLAWLQNQAQPGDVIAEAVGQSYRVDTSRASGFTGLVTLLGWTGHERQWRGGAYETMSAGREEALRLLYAEGTRNEVMQTMETWNIQYVYLGYQERQQFSISEERIDFLSSILIPVYERDEILILAKPNFPSDP